MTRSVLCALVCASFALSGCEKKDEAAPEGEKKATAEKKVEAKAQAPAEKPAEAVPTKKVGLDTNGKTLGGEKVKLEKVKFTGAGYEGEYNEALDSWTYEKWVPNSDGGNDNVVRIYLDTFDDRPADMETFAKKLQEKDFIDYGSHWPEIAKKEAFEGGWVITGTTDDGEDKEPAFAVRVDTLNALCRGYVKPEGKDKDALLAEGVAACKAAVIP